MLSYPSIWRDEASEYNNSSISKQLGDFRYPANVLLAILRCKAKVLVQTLINTIKVKLWNGCYLHY